MKVLIGHSDITQELAKYDGEYMTLQMTSGKLKKCWGGVLTVIPDETPYNPLMDTDCGTDAILGRGGRV